jgi:2,4-dienoyl-CoA reductase-like NADH-dependent reductase (Old Yellow Enzyme family)
MVADCGDRIISVSGVPYDEHTCIPHALTSGDIVTVKKAFLAAAQRAATADLDVSQSKMLNSQIQD